MTEPLKVLHLIETLSSGGAERQLVNLVNSTSRDLITHTVCVIHDSDFFAPSVLESGHSVIDFKIIGKHPFLRVVPEFRNTIKDEKPDIIQSWLYDANISARLASLPLNKIPIVTSLQLPDYDPESALFGNWNPKKVQTLKALDKITSILTKPYYVACSEFVQNSYEQHFGVDKGRISVIHNSVDPSSLTVTDDQLRNLEREFGFDDDAFICLNVARLDPQKNHILMFDAFESVLKEIPTAHLLLAGVGSLETDLRQKVSEKRIDKHVHFLGRRNDIGALLEFADVFVFPSMFEGLGVALVEAMFKSLPPVVSRIEVMGEVVKDDETCLMFEPGSKAELAEAIVKLYKDPELRKRIGGNALREAKNRFDTRITGKQWEALYRKIHKSGHEVV